MAKNIFDAVPLLQGQGIRVVGATAPGVYDVESEDGTVGSLDLNEVLKGQNIDPRTVEYEVNTPGEATDISPVDLLDRGKLMLGNAQGKIGYLKTRFEDVKYDADKGLVVKNHGLWQTVDPAGLGGGDAWEMTKELVKDVVDLGDVALSGVLSGAGASAGAASGLFTMGSSSIPGAMAGAAAGGAAAEGIKTSLGRLAGTYDATPMEQLQDVGIEALLNLGGEGVALGAKATLKQVGKAFKAMAANTPEASKTILSEAMGKATGVGAQTTRTMLEQTDDVVKELTKAKAVGRSTGEVIDHIRSSQIDTAQNILEKAPAALSKGFGELKAQLVDAAGSMPKVNVGGLATDSLASLEQAGLLKRVVTKAADGSARTTFQVMDDITAIEMRNAGKAAEILAPATQKELKPIIAQLNRFTAMGEFEGKTAAGHLMDLKRTVNDIYRDQVGPATPAGVKSLLTKFRGDFAQRVGGVFDAAGLTPAYLKTAQIYEKYADAVAMARRMAQHENGAENFVKKLVSDSGANKTLKDLAKDMADLLGEEGKAMINSINVKEAAKGFSTLLPRMGLSPHVALGAAGAATAVAGPAALGAAAATSPRLALNTVIYGKKALGLIQSLPVPQRFGLLQDPELLETFFRTTFSASMEQERMTEQLAQQATGSK